MERLTPVEAELFVRILQRLNGIDVPE
jgi:hypothetical protein